MSFVVFWIEHRETDSLAPGIEVTAEFREFTDDQMMEALKFAETQRKAGYRHVTMSSELATNVGKPGVDSVEHGVTPDGEAYEWSKQHRGSRGAQSTHD